MMEVPIIVIDGLPVSDEEMERILFEKLLNTENGRRVLSAESEEKTNENVP